jgi:hypothetical protein
MQLRDILQRPEFVHLSDADALVYGNKTVVIGGSSARWDYQAVAKQFGVAASEGILAAIQRAGLPGAAMAYTSGGFDLSDEQTQEKLDAIALAVPSLAAACTALKEIGITHGTRWEQLGTMPPTLAEIVTARASLATEVERNKSIARWNRVIDAYDRGAITTDEQAVTLYESNL